MPCSPHLMGINDPLQILRIIRRHPVLCVSEPSETFYPLEERGWVEYGVGRWCITPAGHEAADDDTSEDASEDAPLPEFFEL